MYQEQNNYGDQIIMDPWPVHAIPPKPENYLSMFVPIDLLVYDDIKYNNFNTPFSEMYVVIVLIVCNYMSLYNNYL